uniref:Retrotransposon gag domain-containing protein n=1 Tax=Maylandia zebra TaxID=106582 RepID=A0A3P9DDX2_9CICH
HLIYGPAAEFRPRHERKRALLIHCLGMEGQRIYSALSLATDDYEGSVKALETYFHPKVNVVAERYHFRQRAQAVSESTDHYVAALRELVKQCKFGAMENEMLRDQLVEKTNNARIRERLLMEEDLTLDRALEIARCTEAAIADAKAIAVDKAHTNFKSRTNSEACTNSKTRKNSKTRTNSEAH